MTWTYPPGWTKDHEPDFWSRGLPKCPKVTQKRGNRSEWSSWYAARARCHRTEDPGWRNYGGRGIFMAPEWFMDFDAFLAHIGPRPFGTTLDRIDNDRGYEPGNVRWATSVEQAANRRHPSRWITRGGGEMDLSDLTPGQRRTAKAVAARMRAAEEKKADQLRERGWVVIPPEAVQARAISKDIATMADRF